jgi:hypothetical protein
MIRQNISEKQIKELNISQLNQLVVFLEMDKYYREARNKTLVYENNVLREIAEFCNIGRMINLLYDAGYNKFRFMIGHETEFYIDNMIESKEIEKPDLCDALWECVRSIL